MSENETEPNYENGEDVQKKLYFINEQLQLMVKNIPFEYQQRFSSELLCGLAECLLDNTVFGIVEHLMDIQNTTEKQLYEKRSRLNKDNCDRINIIKESNFSEEIKQLKINVLRYRYRKKLKNFDKEIIRILDNKREDQQNVLAAVGVPGFQITDDPKKIQIQIRLLDFIFKLSKMKELS